MPASDADSAKMARQLPPNIVSHFTHALKSYQLSNATFRVLCSLTPSSLSSSPTTSPAPQPLKTLPKRLLVLDSSFNPPTLAHQQMALSALSEYKQASGDSSNGNDKSRVLLLLAINNADKAPKPAAFPQRLAMMYIFAQDLLDSAAKTADDRSEGECEGVDIAVTTEPYFHAKGGAVASSAFYRPDSSKAEQIEQVYLTGFDTLIRIFDPKYYPDNSMTRVLDPFFAHAQLRVSMRTDADWGDSAEQLAYLEGLRSGGLEKVGGKTSWVDRIRMVEGRRDGEEVVSSTKVRGAVLRQDWDALKRLVSEDVTSWIRHEALYADVSA